MTCVIIIVIIIIIITGNNYYGTVYILYKHNHFVSLHYHD